MKTLLAKVQEFGHTATFIYPDRNASPKWTPIRLASGGMVGEDGVEKFRVPHYH